MISRRYLHIFLLILGLLAIPSPVAAQFWPALGGRAVSRDGKWLVPVANPLLSSDEHDHLRRGSVNAWDLTVPLGSPVYAMATGEVTYAGCNNAGGYGCWALIDHGDGYSSLYAHLMDEGDGTIWVNIGARVTPWTVLGRVGWTGMTSFGPHVHWEIRHAQQGRLRNDRFFSRTAVTYCKFCAATAEQTTQQANPLNGVAPYASLLLSGQGAVGILLLVLALVLFLRPQMAVAATQRAGGWLHRFLNLSPTEPDGYSAWRKRHWLYLSLIFIAPALLCGSSTAFAVWMAEERVAPTTLIAYWRYGVYPLMGGGYQSGARYSAVWGMPCSGVGTLGRSCDVDEIVSEGLAWQRAIERLSGTSPIPVVIPRLAGHFGLGEARQLLTAMHQEQGMVILDVGENFQLAARAIDQLSEFGLDGIAIDLEYVENAHADDVRALARQLAAGRKQAGLSGDGVLVLWNVFHNLKESSDLTVPGVQIVPIFTGYGNTATKIAGLKRTQQIFAVGAADSGLMAFDHRWPINQRCQAFDTRQGYDCQSWITLFADPTAQRLGWWVQQ